MLSIRKTVPALGAALTACPDLGAPSRDEIIVEIAAAGICGSDLHAYDWDPGYRFMEPHLPLTLGHEFAGRVVAVGDGVDNVALGDPVVCWPTITCGSCDGCLRDKPQYCTARRIIGLHRDGGFASAVKIPARNAFALPHDLPLETAALTEPLSVSVNAVNVGDVQKGDRVIVLGPGMIGMGVALVAQSRGAEVLLAGFDDALRLDLAREMGLTRCIDLKETDLASAAAEFGPIDIVFEATGRASSVVEALPLLRPGGVLAVVGIHNTPATLDLNLLVRGKKQLRGCHDTTREAFAEAIDRLAADPALYARLITHRLPLSQFEQGFATAKARAALKVMLIPHGDTNV